MKIFPPHLTIFFFVILLGALPRALPLLSLPLWSNDDPALGASNVWETGKIWHDFSELERENPSKPAVVEARPSEPAPSAKANEHPPVAYAAPYSAPPERPNVAQLPPAASKETSVAHNASVDSSVAKHKPEEERTPFRMKDRCFELALLDTQVGISNDFIVAKDIFNKERTISIDLDEFVKGVRLDAGVDISPVSLSINWKDKWGFGFDFAHVNVTGNVDLSDKLLRLLMTDEDKFGLGGSAFVDVGIPVFFHVKKFKITFRSAGFFPVVYSKSDFTYIFKNIDTSGTLLELQYNILVNLPIPFEELQDPVESLKTLDANILGYDFSVGAEFPLFPWLDLGLDVKNIPFIPSTPKYFMRMEDKVTVDTSKINYNDLARGKTKFEELVGSGEEYPIRVPESFDPVYGTGDYNVLRPFKMRASANFHPSGSKMLSVIPQVGFAIDPVFVQPFSIEGGVKARLDLANMFVTTIGIIYEDRVWKNSVDFVVFNFRALEFDLGVSVQSSKLLKSWEGAGVGVNVAAKLGF